VPDQLQPDEDGRYARACEEWMSQIRAIARGSSTGLSFKASVQSGHGTLARDDMDQIVIVSKGGSFSTVVDRSLLGTFNSDEFQRWVSSIDRTQLPTKFQVREGQEHGADQNLQAILKHLHSRQAEEAFGLTQSNDRFDAIKGLRTPEIFAINMKNRREQSAAFETERNRYIQEHREALRISEEIAQEEKQRTLRNELGSKFYR